MSLLGQYFHSFVVASFVFILWLLPVWQRFTDNSVQLNDNDVYDFVIVGSGSAGSVLAARLSAERNARVLLLEAGGRKPWIFNIPALGPLLQMSSMDWQYVTVPQTHACSALNHNRSQWPSGRVLGGTSHLNYMLYVPGHISDYESWRDPFSDDWGPADVRFYFKKAETDLQTIRDAVYTTPLSEAVLLAADELGLPKGDVDLDAIESFTRARVNIDASGRRWTFDQGLEKVRCRRPNLKIKTGATVKRVLINENMQAYGVELIDGNNVLQILANHEVILSAGAVGSPHILMLSGIGPPAVLRPAKIAVKLDLPVGQNLRDHVTTGLDLVISKNHIFSMWDLTSIKSAFDYYIFGRGPWTGSLCETIALLNTTKSRIELMVMMAGVSTDAGIFSRHSLGLKNEIWESYFRTFVDRNVASIMPVLLYPKSVGHVQLNPSNPDGPPLIDPNYLSHEEDVETLVEGIETVYRLVNSHAMRQAGFRFNRRLFPGCEHFMFSRPDYWRCYIRKLTLTSYHPTGTCRMGSVVDHQLRVKGIKHLRVVDASVMPTMPGGNTNAAVVMISEKAADLIIADYCSRNVPCLLMQHVFIPPQMPRSSEGRKRPDVDKTAIENAVKLPEPFVRRGYHTWPALNKYLTSYFV